MICESCGTENQPGLRFCGNCGTKLSEASLVLELDEADDLIEASPVLELDEADDLIEASAVLELDEADDLVVRPSQWAWGVYAAPMVVIYALLMSVDVFTFGVLPVAVLAAFIIPRYITWRGSSYTLNSDSLIIKRGQLGRGGEAPVLYEEIEWLEERQGFLGPTLQYTSVHIFLEDGRQGVLSYVPVGSPLIDRLLAKGIMYGPPTTEEEDEEEGQGVDTK
jgi:hypothetical protein